MVDEEDFLNSVSWRYFASREYNQLFALTEDFPNNDSAPRVWALVEGTDHSWNPYGEFFSQQKARRPRPVSLRQ
jgi:hypothetical protein